jgi:hypothetical protein
LLALITARKERERERETPHILDTVPRTPPTVAYFLR